MLSRLGGRIKLLRPLVFGAPFPQRQAHRGDYLVRRGRHRRLDQQPHAGRGLECIRGWAGRGVGKGNLEDGLRAGRLVLAAVPGCVGDAHNSVGSNKQNRSSIDSLPDGEALPLHRLSSHIRLHDHTSTLFHLDLGIGLTPSTGGSLNRSFQNNLQDGPEKAT